MSLMVKAPRPLMQNKTVLSIMMGLVTFLTEDGTTYSVLSLHTGCVKELCAETIMFTMYQIANVLLQCIHAD